MKRLECLDGLRGLLAIYVLLGHMAPFACLPFWLQSIVSHGGAAVDLFFALSGLVIVQSLHRGDGQARPFLMARAARIFPVYFPVLALAVLVQPLSCGFERTPWLAADSPARTICVSGWPQQGLVAIAAHLTMTHGLFPDAILPDAWVSFLGSAWSLSTEWQFYLLTLLVSDRRRLAWLLLCLSAAGAAWRIAGPEGWQFSRAFLGNQGHFFALGVAGVDVVRREAHAANRYGCVLLAALVICATQGIAGKLLPPLAWTACLPVQTCPRQGLARLLNRLLASRICLWLGAMSYCVYLVNEPVHKLIGLALSHSAGGNGLLFTVIWIPAAILLPIAVSVALHAWVEVPGLRWGRAYAVRAVSLMAPGRSQRSEQSA